MLPKCSLNFDKLNKLLNFLGYEIAMCDEGYVDVEKTYDIICVARQSIIAQLNPTLLNKKICKELETVGLFAPDRQIVLDCLNEKKVEVKKNPHYVLHYEISVSSICI